eukprot:Skav201930  [mRNA]  locus=scaffold3992:329762:332208:+ [translate_table: standard]
MPSSSLAVAVCAVAATLAVQWLWARSVRRNGNRKGYSSIEASKDPEVVHGVSRMAKLQLFHSAVEHFTQGADLATPGVAHSSPLTSLLGTVAQQTRRRLRLPQMLSSPLTVQLLCSLIRASGATRILEIGTYTGFTALGMAEILPADGSVVCLDDFSDEAQAEALFHEMISAAGSVGQRIQLRKENALLGVRRLAAEVEAQKAPAFDLCFIDADKELGSAGIDLSWL